MADNPSLYHLIVDETECLLRPLIKTGLLIFGAESYPVFRIYRLDKSFSCAID